MASCERVEGAPEKGVTQFVGHMVVDTKKTLIMEGSKGINFHFS